MGIFKILKELNSEKLPADFKEAIRLFNEECFQEAQLKLEGIWMKTKLEDEKLLRAFMHMTGSCHHYSQGQYEAAARLYQNSRELLSAYLPQYKGINIVLLIEQMDEIFQLLIDNQTIRSNHPRSIKYPKIEFV